MRIQIFSTYQQLALDGKVAPLVCTNLEHVNPLVPALDDRDEIYLYCLECPNTLVPGINMYEDIYKQVEKLYIEPTDN